MWFGETFGDKLTTLKGQITKITKEVLAEDESSSNEKKDSVDELVKELTTLCEEKDLEIANLKDELKKLNCTNEGGLLNPETKCDESNFVNSKFESEVNISDLSREIQQLKEERNHLNSCLDELQLEHQGNLEQVISMKDKYKEELENLKKDYNDVKSQVQILSEAKISDNTITEFKNELSTKENQICLLKKEIEALYTQLKVYEKEKNDMSNDVKKTETEKENLSREINILISDNKVLTDEKNQINEENKKLRAHNENLLKSLECLKKEKAKFQNDSEKLPNDNEDLQKQHPLVVQSDSSVISWSDMPKKFKEKFQKFGITLEENNQSFEAFVNLLETKMKKSEEENKNLLQTTYNINYEVKELKEKNLDLENKIKQINNKWIDEETKYQSNIAELNKRYQNNSSLEMKIAELEKQKEDYSQSQTDDVKRLEQEVKKLLALCQTKTDETAVLLTSKVELEHEVQRLTNVLDLEKQNSASEILLLQNKIQLCEANKVELTEAIANLETKLKALELDKSSLEKTNVQLKSETEEIQKKLKNSSEDVDKLKSLENQLEKVNQLNKELQTNYSELCKKNSVMRNELEDYKAQLIIKESSTAELIKSNTVFQEEIARLKTKNIEFLAVEKDLQKWKNAAVDLEIQKQDLFAKIEVLEGECLKLRSNLELLNVKDNEIAQLKQTNVNLVESCNRLHFELENKAQAEQFEYGKENDLTIKLQEQALLMSELQEENNELKIRIQKFQDQIKSQLAESQAQVRSKEEVLQHKRSKSAASYDSTLTVSCQEKESNHSEDLLQIRAALQLEQNKYREIYTQYQVVLEKESNARKELERLKQHLIEVEDHYTEEAVENKQIIDDLKSKLMAAEEQMKNSSTLYTSVKVRDNQHLESLQSQLRLITNQRDELQTKLSVAEDEVQKHQASLINLQVVLEQFQQEKEQEVQEVSVKCERQIQMIQNHFHAKDVEITNLQKQLGEAKTGLQAASRLGEQLEKKAHQLTEVEENLKISKNKIAELEENLRTANQNNSGKVDKSLLKNLLVGYILSPNADRKSQALRILASVLDFDQEERDKMGVDASHSGWLSNILHPKPGGPPPNQSFSEAFIKFLENESRPQPQLKLLPDQFKTTKPKPSMSNPKPVGVFSELMLPTFNSQESESSIILKNVLKDS